MPQLNSDERAYARVWKAQGLKAVEICDKILELRRTWHKAAKVRPADLDTESMLLDLEMYCADLYKSGASVVRLLYSGHWG